MKQTYKEGDKVIIRRDLLVDGDLEFGVVDEMLEYQGEPSVVTLVKESSEYPENTVTGHDGYEYYIDLDGGEWVWSNRMFTGTLGKEALLEGLSEYSKTHSPAEYFRLLMEASQFIGSPENP